MFVTKADTVGKVTTWLSLTRCYHPHFGYKGTHKTHMLVQSIPTKLHTIETKMGPYWQRIRPFFYIFFLAYSFSSSLDHLFFSATMRLNMAFLTPTPTAQNTVYEPSVLIFLPHPNITMYSNIHYTRLTTTRP